MSRGPDWMTASDEVILYVLRDANVALSPSVIEANSVISSQTAQRRLQGLLENDLVQKEDDAKGYYKITNRGQAYLEGNLAPAELEPPE